MLIIILCSAAAGVILLLALAIRSLVALSVEPKQVEAARTEFAAQSPTSAPEGEAPAAEHLVSGHEVAPMPEQAPMPAPQAQAPKKTSEFNVDYRTISEREEGRKAMIKTIRQQARENPESGAGLSDEQIRQLEQSGSSVQ